MLLFERILFYCLLLSESVSEEVFVFNMARSNAAIRYLPKFVLVQMLRNSSDLEKNISTFLAFKVRLCL